MQSSITRSSRRGGALILALLFMGVITAGFVVWVSLIQQRARVADFEEQQARKRLSITNAKVLAKEYLLRRVMASNHDDTLSAVSNGGSLSNTDWIGNSEISTTVWSGFPLDSSTRLAGLNGFSPTFDYPYSKSITFTASNRLLSYIPINATTNAGLAQFAGDATTIRGYIRSRNPVLSGDLLVLHRPTVTTTLPTVSGNLEVEGRVVHFAPETTTYSARSQRFTAPASASVGLTAASIAGGSLLWSNLSWFPYSAGNTNLSATDLATDDKIWHFPNLTGQLNFIDASTTNPSNNLRAELIASGSTIQATGSTNFSDSRGFNLVSTGTSPSGSGLATITPCLGSSTADLPSIVISNDLTELIIEGQTGTNLTGYAPYRPAMSIVYTQNTTGRNLATIRLRNQNTRRLMIALKKDHRTASDWNPNINVIVETPGTGTSEWNVVFLCENVPLTFTTTSVTTVRVVGGIQTNSPLVFPASPKLFDLNLQTDTRGLIRMCPRLAWVETFLTGEL